VLSIFPDWVSGGPTRERLMGVPGMAWTFRRGICSHVGEAFTRLPKGWNFAQAATLPRAALTAWRALMVEARIKPGDVVLTQGTGGVSIFAVQLAKAAGATVIATSSSDEKLARLRDLGADHLINYRWGRSAAALAGQGVDALVEIGGPGTLSQFDPRRSDRRSYFLDRRVDQSCRRGSDGFSHVEERVH
jgi:NADPH:quinone reductase-like Zn-dependent oxidoreductase